MKLIFAILAVWLLTGCAHPTLMVNCKVAGSVNEKPIYTDCEKL